MLLNVVNNGFEIFDYITKNFIIILSFSYIISKIFSKALIRNLIGIPSDSWEIISWFSVDVAFITLGICVAKINICALPSEIKVVWFFGLVLIIFLSTIFYGFFIKRKNIIKTAPIKDLRLFFNITFSYFISFGGLLLSYNYY